MRGRGCLDATVRSPIAVESVRLHRHFDTKLSRPAFASAALLRLVELFGFPTLTRRRPVSGATPTRLADFVRCHVLWQLSAPHLPNPSRRPYRLRCGRIDLDMDTATKQQ